MRHLGGREVGGGEVGGDGSGKKVGTLVFQFLSCLRHGGYLKIPLPSPLNIAGFCRTGILSLDSLNSWLYVLSSLPSFISTAGPSFSCDVPINLTEVGGSESVPNVAATPLRCR